MILCAVLALAIRCGRGFAADRSDFEIVWFDDGILLAVLLLAPRWLWPEYLVAGFVGLFVGSAWIHEPVGRNLLLSSMNLMEAVVPALILRRRSTQLPDFTRPGYLLRFVAFAGVMGPLLPGLMKGGMNLFLHHGTFVGGVRAWFLGDSLSVLCVTPCMVAILRTRWRSLLSPGWKLL